MGAQSDRVDHAAPESFFATLKKGTRRAAASRTALSHRTVPASPLRGSDTHRIRIINN
jgi:hypothetical protein